ncbi:MAG: thioredoxin family protein [Saprospiraceae bacterium]
MKKITREVINNAWTYDDYRTKVDELFAQGKTTGDNHSDAMLNYTKLNIFRMKRLDKTTRLTEVTLAQIQKENRKITWLVITEAWCGDAAQIIPVLNKLAAENDNINLKMILRDENLEIMDQFLTNGSRSIPILIVLDSESLEVLNSWGPRPTEVQEMVMEAKLNASNNPEDSKEIWDEAKKNAQIWYTKDKSKTIQAEILGIK